MKKDMLVATVNGFGSYLHGEPMDYSDYTTTELEEQLRKMIDYVINDPQLHDLKVANDQLKIDLNQQKITLDTITSERNGLSDRVVELRQQIETLKAKLQAQEPPVENDTTDPESGMPTATMNETVDTFVRWLGAKGTKGGKHWNALYVSYDALRPSHGSRVSFSRDYYNANKMECRQFLQSISHWASTHGFNCSFGTDHLRIVRR